MEKLNNFRDYIKCVLSNKYTLAGYVLAVAAPLTFFFGEKIGLDPELKTYLSFGLGVESFFLFRATSLGLETLSAYNRTKNHIKEFKTIGKKFEENLGKAYCCRAGIKLAAREAGLSKLLN